MIAPKDPNGDQDLFVLGAVQTQKKSNSCPDSPAITRGRKKPSIDLNGVWISSQDAKMSQSWRLGIGKGSLTLLPEVLYLLNLLCFRPGSHWPQLILEKEITITPICPGHSQISASFSAEIKLAVSCSKWSARSPNNDPS